MSGGRSPAGEPGRLDHARLFRATPTPYLVLDPDLVIVEVNDAYLRATGRSRAELLGCYLFDAFPTNPQGPDVSGVPNLRASLERVRDTGRPDTMALQRYDIPDGAGTFAVRYWSPVNVPVRDDDGRTVLLLHRVEDVTDFVREREQGRAERARGEDYRRRVVEAEADLYARARELRTALESEALATRRLTTLVDLAGQLAGCETVAALTEVVIDRGLAALGADGGAVAVRDGDRMRLTLTDSLGGHTRERYADLPSHGPLPASVAALRGENVLLPDRDAALAWSDAMADVLADTGLHRWASLPLRVGDRLLGSLTVGWRDGHPFAPREVELLGAFAAQCAQTLDRIRVHQAQRQTSETLQRSLLTEPPHTPGLAVAVRYHPATAHDQVGGDWYDAFPAADGATTLVIGDVTGHDRRALAAMAQIRNTLRGVAYLMGAPPAAILAGLERVLAGLRVPSLATAVLAHVWAPGQPGGAPDGARMLWCNAGHPPPVLIGPDGDARLLEAPVDPLLGLRPPRERHDHELLLAAGSTVLFYTDGLVERPGCPLDEGLHRLRVTAGRLAHLPVERLCDAVLADLVDAPRDDIALLALRVTG
ncbi:SpoIIE family protein phosphatase [Micromonospora coxensis]|uniref:GAF domain-containing protein n=1 Tax=Micromonospora coxensis TaxID=356852 RepID=A0A1C5JRA8_9ACTN|nr:SpoIIE family protein phosphatase [Micromonospora coxensis]SCG72556.1 GAF domain-containing protein [Micromonospora coxensis]